MVNLFSSFEPEHTFLLCLPQIFKILFHFRINCIHDFVYSLKKLWFASLFLDSGLNLIALDGDREEHYEMAIKKWGKTKKQSNKDFFNLHNQNREKEPKNRTEDAKRQAE